MDALRLSPQLLAAAGFSALTSEQATSILRELYDTLELRVGRRLGRKLSDAQLSAFERLTSGPVDHGAAQWLEQNVPGYQAEVADELDYILDRLREANATKLASRLPSSELDRKQP